MSIDTSKIIHGVVGGGRYTVTSPIVKEDYGLYLQIEGLELPSTYEVDFSNSEHNGTSVTMIGNADGVLIPNQFISSGKDVFAFLYHVGADFGRTVYKFRIPNKLRPDRTNEEPTPEEQSVIDQTISALNDAVAQTAQDKADADVSAQNASADAERAEEARTDAQNYATQAEQSATDASQSASQASASATASAQSASQSAQIKADVEDLADDAQASASASAQSATASANSASQASASATSASQSASSAQGYASQAQTSAQTASAKASEASGYASTASQKATESAQSASQALTYKTDAEQAKTASQTAQGLAESARDSAISAQESAEDARDEAQSIVDGISAKAEQIDQNTADIASLEEDRYKPYAVDSASGAIASFVDGADDIPLKSLVVDIDPVQDLHGYDSPWVGGGGKNVFNQALMRDREAWYNIAVKVRPSTKYTISTDKGTQTATGLALYFKNTNTQGGGSASIVYSGNPVTVTSTEDGYVYVSQRRVSGEDSFQNYHYQIEEGTVVTDWTPYENICPITGWTECNIDATGKNLLNANKYYGDYKQSDGSYLLSANNLTNIQIPLKAFIGKTVTFSAETTIEATPTNLRARAYINGRGTDGNTATPNATSTTSVTATPVTDDDYIHITFGSGGSDSVTLRNVQIEEGSAVTDYEQFGTPVIISLGQTVYGAHIDVLNGVLTVTHQAKTFDGTENWLQIDAGKFYINKSLTEFDVYDSEWISNKYPYSGFKSQSNSMGIDKSFYTNYNSGSTLKERIFVLDSSFADADAFKSSLVTNPLTACGMLKEPIEVQLDAYIINSLLGANNIFADTGDCEVEYRADTRLYIEKLTQPEEDDMVADSAITSGQFFMIGNSLYQALANIASGATITVGTNAQRVSLADALNLVNA